MPDEPESTESPETTEAETLEGPPPSDYEPGAGNAFLDSLYDLEKAEPVQEDVQEDAPEPGAPAEDAPPAVTIESALARAADSEDQPEPVAQEEAREEEEEEKEAPKLTKEDLTSQEEEFTPELQSDKATPPPENRYDPDEYLVSAVSTALGDASEDLSDSDYETLELAKYASLKFPDKYPDLAVKMATFYKKRKDFIAKQGGDGYDEYDFSPDDSGTAQFIKDNEPKFTASERKAIEKAQLKDEVLSEARGEIAQANHQRDLMAREPKVEKTIQKFFTDCAEDIFPEDIQAVVKEHGIDKAREQFSFEVPMLESTLQNASHYARTFLRLSNGLEAFDQNNAIHQQVSHFIENQGQIFTKEGGEARVRDGKKFVTRADYNNLPQDKKVKYWTFSDEDILSMVQIQLKQGATEHLNDLRQRLSTYGNGSAPSPVAEPQAPKATRTKSAGATSSATAAKGSSHAVLDVLGL